MTHTIPVSLKQVAVRSVPRSSGFVRTSLPATKATRGQSDRGALQSARSDATLTIVRPQLPAQWHTARLIVRDAQEHEAAHYLRLFNDNVRAGVRDPSFAREITLDEMRIIVRDSLRERRSRPMLRLQGAWQGDECVAYFQFVHRHPRDDDPTLAWVAMFVVAPERQGQGLGRELAQGLLDQCSRLTPLRAIQLKVYARNTPGLQFWFACGFRMLVALRPESEPAGEPHLGLVLECPLVGSAEPNGPHAVVTPASSTPE